MEKKGAYPPPYSLRLTQEERDELNQLSGVMPVSAYIRMRLFDAPSPRKRRIAGVNPDHALVADILSALGQSRLSSNLNQLARAVNTGALDLDDESKAELIEACREVKAMRGLLIEALKLKDDIS